MFSKKLVVFDLAGTLIDKGSICPIIALKKAFDKNNVRVSDVKDGMGLNKLDHIKYLLDKSTNKDSCLTQKIYEDFKSLILEVLSDKENVSPIANSRMVIDALHSSNINVAITTGYNYSQASTALKTSGLLLLDEIHLTHGTYDNTKCNNNTIPIITSSNVSRGRPYPYMIFKAMDIFDIKNVKNVLKVGDTEADMEAAKNAGVSAVITTTGIYKLIENYAPYVVINNLLEVFKYLWNKIIMFGQQNVTWNT